MTLRWGWTEATCHSCRQHILSGKTKVNCFEAGNASAHCNSFSKSAADALNHKQQQSERFRLVHEYC